MLVSYAARVDDSGTPPLWPKGEEGGTPERHARVPVSRVGISSTSWHREIKIHSRLLFSPTDECVSKDRERISNDIDTKLNTLIVF